MRMARTRQSRLEASTAGAESVAAGASLGADFGLSGSKHLSIADRNDTAGAGIYVYGLSGIALGLAGLVGGDFSTNWQHVKPTVPFREGLAYITAVSELAAGAAMLWRPTARMGAAVLTTLFVIFTLLWVPEVLKAPGIFDNWGNFFEEFSLVVGGAVALAMLSRCASRWAGKVGLLSRIYGVCPISFGLAHIIYFKAAASWVPKWIPPGQMFWAGATAVSFLLAAGAILTATLSGLASRLLTAQIVGFEFLVWAPKMFAAPHEHFAWAGNAVCVALAGATWVVSDAICGLRRTATSMA